MKQSYFKILIITILTGGCHSIKLQNNRSYIFSSPKKAQVLFRLELFNNQTFEYKINGGMYQANSSGRWNIDRNKLYLKSFEDYRSGYCKIRDIGVANLTKEELTVQVVDDKQIPLGGALVFYGNNRDTATRDGYVSFKRGIDTVVRVNFLGINYEAPLHDISTGNARIEVFLKDISKIYLDNEAWTIQHNTVISPSNRKLFRRKE